MILSMSDQTMIFFTAVLSGFIIGFIYDLFRIFRKSVKHPNFLTQIEDVIFWILVTLLLFYVMVSKNYGEIRAFSIVGAFIGMVLYFSTVSILFIKLSIIVIDFVNKVIFTMFNIILSPFKIFYKAVRAPLVFCKRKTAFYTKKILYNSKKYAKMKSAEFTNEIRIITKKV